MRRLVLGASVALMLAGLVASAALAYSRRGAVSSLPDRLLFACLALVVASAAAYAALASLSAGERLRPWERQVGRAVGWVSLGAAAALVLRT